MDLMKPKKNAENRLPEERQNFLACPHCGELFDMRDLLAVLQHQHHSAPVPPMTWSGAVRAQVPMRFPRMPQAPN
jgi:hypothetical protein